MSDTKTCEELLAKYLKARIPFIAVNSIERGRVLEIFKRIAEELGIECWAHAPSRGVYDLTSDKTINEDPTWYSAIDCGRDHMKKRQNATLILTDVPDISGDTADTRPILDLVELASRTGGALVVLCTGSIWNQLQRYGLVVTLDCPHEDEMYGIVKELIDDYRGSISIEWDDVDIREAAALLSGVSRIEAENVISSLIANGSVRKADMDEVRYAKDRLFSDISGIEKIDVDESACDVGGLSGLQAWLAEKKELLTPEKRALMKSRGLQPPRGILLVGVPGCGKSLSAKSIAANWKLPLYRLDFATVQGSYVGQSEQQLKDALSMAEQVAPCVLWIDEIEKGLSGARATNDGGVSTRMVGQFLFWLQECKKQVFVVATANDVSMLPSELLRRGRFDELFFVDLPTEEERRDILALYMRKYLGLSFTGELADRLVEQTEGFTGADLESSIRDIAYRTIAKPETELSADFFIAAFNNVVPLSQTSPEKIEAIRDWGRERAVPASGRPIGSQTLREKEASKTRKVLV